MRRSKLEMYVDVLKVLARHGPLKLTHIMYKANVNCSVLRQYLDFLIQHNLVEEQTLHKRRNKKRVVYAITERGRTVLKYFRELNNALQITEEANKIPASLYQAKAEHACNNKSFTVNHSKPLLMSLSLLSHQNKKLLTSLKKGNSTRTRSTFTKIKTKKQTMHACQS